MAAPSRDEVDMMIQSAFTAFEQRVGLHMQAKAAEQVTIEQARAGLDDVTLRTRQESRTRRPASWNSLSRTM